MIRYGRTTNRIGLHATARLLGLIFMVGLVSQTAEAQSRYTVTDLGTIGYGQEGGAVAPSDVNIRGEVVGIYRPSNSYDQAFIYSGGQIHQLGNLFDAVGRGINNIGQAVGLYAQEDLFDSASAYLFLYSNGQAQQIMPGNNGYANAINDRGEVTGGFYKGGHGPEHAFIYTVSTGKVRDLGSLGEDSEGLSINIRGQVVGVYFTAGNVEHGFLYTNQKMYDLGGTFEPARINDFGQIVGNALLPGNVEHAFLYSNGQMHDLGTLPGTTSSAATGINDLGQIVGTSGGRPFLYQNGHMYDLSALLVPGSAWALQSGTVGVFGGITINAFGQIAANGNNGVRDDNGWVETHALLLTPALMGFLQP
jgi:probable HAF family extracellular repeat protein